jgi:hypothetical protein
MGEHAQETEVSFGISGLLFSLLFEEGFICGVVDLVNWEAFQPAGRYPLE